MITKLVLATLIILLGSLILIFSIMGLIYIVGNIIERRRENKSTKVVKTK